ncbi:MAG TPA: helix-turn-helix domain-containing protein, partial [Candidatus Methylacidiphilales bacterium]
VLPLKPAEAASLLPLFREMRREFAAGEPGAADVIRGFLHAALVRAERLYARAFARRHPREVGVLASSAALETLPRPARLAREFRLAVEGRFRDLASVPAYAKLLRVTPNHLNDTVRAETGRPAGHWIRQRRLLEAKRLLLHSDLDAAEIGYRLGFGDPSYFGRFFLREEGSSPAAFRERIREKYQRTSR